MGKMNFLFNEMGKMRKGFGFESGWFEMLVRHPVERLSRLLNIPEFRRQTRTSSTFGNRQHMDAV